MIFHYPTNANPLVFSMKQTYEDYLTQLPTSRPLNFTSLPAAYESWRSYS